MKFLLQMVKVIESNEQRKLVFSFFSKNYVDDTKEELKKMKIIREAIESLKGLVEIDILEL